MLYIGVSTLLIIILLPFVFLYAHFRQRYCKHNSTTWYYYAPFGHQKCNNCDKIVLVHKGLINQRKQK